MALLGQPQIQSQKIKHKLTVLMIYVIEIAQKKADVMFKRNLDYYINWLICSVLKHLSIGRIAN